MKVWFMGVSRAMSDPETPAIEPSAMSTAESFWLAAEGRDDTSMGRPETA
jgi:hypothetical protein